MRRLVTILVLAALATLARAQQSALPYSVPVSAVSSALAAKSIALSSDHIRLTSSVPSSTPDPVLRLLALDLQPDGTLAARLSCQVPSECRPFFAILSLPDHMQAISVLQTFRNSNPTTQPAVASRGGIAVGARVTLHLSDRQMRIQLEGIAIDAAPPGQEIRVASLDRHHIYRGVVIDTTTVEGDLP